MMKCLNQLMRELHVNSLPTGLRSNQNPLQFSLQRNSQGLLRVQPSRGSWLNKGAVSVSDGTSECGGGAIGLVVMVTAKSMTLHSTGKRGPHHRMDMITTCEITISLHNTLTYLLRYHHMGTICRGQAQSIERGADPTLLLHLLLRFPHLLGLMIDMHRDRSIILMVFLLRHHKPTTITTCRLATIMVLSTHHHLTCILPRFSMVTLWHLVTSLTQQCNIHNNLHVSPLHHGHSQSKMGSTARHLHHTTVTTARADICRPGEHLPHKSTKLHQHMLGESQTRTDNPMGHHTDQAPRPFPPKEHSIPWILTTTRLLTSQLHQHNTIPQLLASLLPPRFLPSSSHLLPSSLRSGRVGL